MKIRFKIYRDKIAELVELYGENYAKNLLIKKNVLLADKWEINDLEQEVITDERIHKIVNDLSRTDVGTESLKSNPASYKMYSSFYWKIRFLADIGITCNHVDLESAINSLFLYQLPNGQFTVGFHRNKTAPVSLICITANLIYSLAKLGYNQTRQVQAGLNYILTTQRVDGGWHCDWKKQPGEKEQNAPSCPTANIFVVRAIAAMCDNYEDICKNAVDQILGLWGTKQVNNCFCSYSDCHILKKLRYPPHYQGLDILHVVDTLSQFECCRNRVEFDEMVDNILNKWDGNFFLRSEKTIPEWRMFDFGKNNQYSSWISALVCNVLNRMNS